MNILQEMAKELLPSLTPKEDLILIKQLKKLEKKDPLEFDEKLARINLTRRSEGLPSLHKNEILSKTLIKDIKLTKPKKGMGDENLRLLNKGVSSNVFKGDGTIKIELEGERCSIYLKSHLSDDNLTMNFKIFGTTIPWDVNYIIKDKEIRFPELGKKIKFEIDWDTKRVYYSAKIVKL